MPTRNVSHRIFHCFIAKFTHHIFLYCCKMVVEIFLRFLHSCHGTLHIFPFFFDFFLLFLGCADLLIAQGEFFLQFLAFNSEYIQLFMHFLMLLLQLFELLFQSLFTFGLLTFCLPLAFSSLFVLLFFFIYH